MKYIIKYFLLVVLLDFCGAAIPVNNASAQEAEVSFQVFYDQLSPYGHWVDYPEYGYVWIPANASGFSPYQSGGHWVFTDYGWTWVSNYQWGWAPFHYGRWDFDDDYGWFWIPDYEWAPAWVAWSRAPGYYGWAPLRPEIEINVAITSGYYAPPEHWCYVHEEFLGRPDMEQHFVARSENITIIRNSEMINNTYIDNSRHTTYIAGPPREDVEKATGAPIKQYQIAQRSTPGQTAVSANQVSLYRPAVAKATAGNPAPAPTKVASFRDVAPLPGRTPSPEHLNAASSSAAQQTSRQNEKINAQTRTQVNPNVATETKQQPLAQPAQVQNIPKVNQFQQNAPKQAMTPRQLRAQRFAPPAYQAPRPSAMQPHAQPHMAPAQHGEPKQDGKQR